MEMVHDILEVEGLTEIVGAEIGIDRADTCVHLLKNSDIKHLYCIDPFDRKPYRYEQAIDKLKQFSNYTLLKMTSTDAAEIVPDDLDFIFIDGDHSYEGVKADLENWVPKIKPGGVLIGHDWTRFDKGVVLAAGEFLSKNHQLFEPLLEQDELIRAYADYPKSNFRVGGYYKDKPIVHKQRGNSSGGLWWRKKKLSTTI